MDKRPVNLSITRLPIPALVSITHRITGMVLLGGILVLLWMLDMSLESEQGFGVIKSLLNVLWFKLLLWAVLSALAYHFVAGVRHLIMDLGFWETLGGGKASAATSLVLSVILIGLAGVWLW